MWDELFVFFMWEECESFEAKEWTVVRRIMVPQDVHCLMSGACEYVNLYGKRDFTDVLKNIDFDVGRLSCIICIYNCIVLIVKNLSWLWSKRNTMMEDGSEWGHMTRT